MGVKIGDQIVHYHYGKGIYRPPTKRLGQVLEISSERVCCKFANRHRKSWVLLEHVRLASQDELRGELQ